MGAVAAKPKAEWFSFGQLFDKVIKILKGRAGGIACAPTGLEIARAPTFAGEPNLVAGLFEEVRINREFFRQKAMQISAFLESMRRR